MERSSLTNLSPSNFAFVMSTGITATIFFQSGWYLLCICLLTVGTIGYIGLVSLFAYRLYLLKSEVLKDFKDIQKMFKYLTFSAASSSLAISFCLLGYNSIGFLLAIIGACSAILLTYTLFCTLFFHIQVPIQKISPFWLLLAIASNSSGFAITTLWKNNMLSDQLFLLLAFSFWSFGIFIYIMFMTLNMYRMLFYSFEGKDMDPCYWTCMGAAAIAVVDGSQFILVSNLPPFFEEIKPFMEGMLLCLWCWATTWIPVMCLMELWKKFYFKVPFHYKPSLWAMVFPLGMYTAATELLSFSLNIQILQGIVPLFLWITFFMWCLVAYLSKLNPFAKDLAYV